MVVLGFDTATPSTAVALMESDGATVELRDDPAPGAHPGHATRLLAMTGELLARSPGGWSAVERIAVGLGPGTFTGLRIGVATARGLAQSLGAELIGVSSLCALASGAFREGATQPDPAPGVLAVLDARRGQAFIAAYAPPEPPQENPRELSPPRALAPEELGEAVELLGVSFATAVHGWLAVGDGAIRFREQLTLAGAVVPADDSPVHRVSGEAICALGAAGEPAASVEEITPEYGRRPDAEIALGASGR